MVWRLDVEMECLWALVYVDTLLEDVMCWAS